MNRHPVLLVGAGPGDPELLTLKAYRALSDAEVVVYDRLVGADIMALVPTACERIYAGKRKHLHAMPQEQINQVLVTHALRGRKVVRLKGGDPFIFGRGGEEVAALRARGLDVEVIPGITAASAAAASQSLPLTHRGVSQSVTFITAHRQDGELRIDWPLVLGAAQTVAFYMGFSLLEELVAELLARGVAPATQLSIVSRASTAQERAMHGTLATILDDAQTERLEAPAVLILHRTPAGVMAKNVDQALALRPAVSG